MAMAPEQPLAGWFRELDGLIEGSPGFFNGRPIILDAAKMPRAADELRQVIADLGARGIRVMALEGADGIDISPDLPPVVAGTRGSAVARPATDPAASGAAMERPDVLLVDQPIRSGQTIAYKGDVTVIGAVSSGAEIVAGGSIHVYGALRGRAMAGSIGDNGARIFCTRLEAELIAINGLYQTADDMPERLRGKAVQARLTGDAITLAELN